MAGFGFSLKIWSMQQHNVSDKNLTTTVYHDKPTKDSPEISDLGLLKKSYIISRQETWTPDNKRGKKLRDNLRILEESFQSSVVVSLIWKAESLLQVVFSSGLIAHVEVATNNDIVQIKFERGLVGKIANAVSAVGGDDFMCFSLHSPASQLTHISFKSEPVVSTRPIPGPNAKVNRHLCINASQELAVCWWKFGPWLQTAREDEKVNIVVMDCSASRLEVTSSIRSEHELFDVQFSQRNPKQMVVVKRLTQLLTLERSRGASKERQLDAVVYECGANSTQRLAVVSFPLNTGILSSARNRDEDRVAVGCSDGTCHVLDLVTRRCTRVVTCPERLVPTVMAWVGAAVVVGSGRGELAMFDHALNPLRFFDLHHKDYTCLQLVHKLASGGSGLCDVVVNPWNVNAITIFFNGGPIAAMQVFGELDNPTVIHRHLSNDKVAEAIAVATTIDWNLRGGDEALTCVLAIADHLLQRPLNFQHEDQLQATFACFYSSQRPIDDQIVVKHRTPLSCYLRRFFHHLMHHMRLEQAFLLANDIQSSDLFRDIHFAARDLGEVQLCRLAKRRADQLDLDNHEDADSTVPTVAELNMSHTNDDTTTDFLAEALRKQALTDATRNKSTLRVTNLGYV